MERQKTLRGSALYRLKANVNTTAYVELQLLILTFCTGIQGGAYSFTTPKTQADLKSDATTFPEHHCLASNQTGNTVFLCLSLILPQLNGEMFVASSIGMALGLFLVGGWITGQLSHLIGPRIRWWLIACNLTQTIFVLAAAAIQCRLGSETHRPWSLAVIGMLALASGSQVVQSRSLEVTEISTAMATAAWVDLMIDKNLLALNNRPRTRRIAFLVSLAAGTLTGAAIHKSTGPAAAIAVSGGGKVFVTLLYILGPLAEPPNVSPALV